jgi:hypothetical protein
MIRLWKAADFGAMLIIPSGHGLLGEDVLGHLVIAMEIR